MMPKWLEGLISDLHSGDTSQGACTLAADYILSVIDMFTYDVTCPCCGNISVCVDGCTFSEDAPSAYDNMEHYRAALWSKPKLRAS